jgi:hypothetical protein
MGSGRARGTAVAGLIAAALLAAGCGESRHANDQRPSPPTRISVTVNPKEVIVQPLKVAFGPERTRQTPQNKEHQQPPIKTRAPLDVIFVTANQTERDLRLKIRGIREESDPIFAHSSGYFQVELPAGSYTITAAGIPGAKSARLAVGSFRASSQNDVLLP